MVNSMMRIQSQPQEGAWNQFSQRVKQTLTRSNLQLTSKLSSIARYSEVTIKEGAKLNYDKLALENLKAFGFVNGPFAIQAIGTKVLEYPNATTNDRIENTLTIFAKVGTVGESIDAGVAFLKKVGVIHSLGAWLKPLAITCGVLEIVGIALAVKNLVDTHIFSSKLNKQVILDPKEDTFSIEDYRRGVKLLLDSRDKAKSFIKDYVHSDEPLISHRLMVIESNAERKLNSSDPAERAEGRRSLKTTMEALKNRVNSKKWSDRFNVFASLISAIGTFICLFTPLAPLGFGFCVLGGVVALLNNYVFEKRVEDQFKKAIFSE